MHRWIRVSLEVSKKIKIETGYQLASFTMKPSVASIANGTNDIITDLLVIGPKLAPSIDIALFSQSDMTSEHYLGGLSVKNAKYYNIFGSLIAEYHDLHIPIKATGAQQNVYGTILVPPHFSSADDYRELGNLIIKFGVQQA